MDAVLRRWMYAAAGYNALWGPAVVVFAGAETEAAADVAAVAIASRATVAGAGFAAGGGVAGRGGGALDA